VYCHSGLSFSEHRREFLHAVKLHMYWIDTAKVFPRNRTNYLVAYFSPDQRRKPKLAEYQLKVSVPILAIFSEIGRNFLPGPGNSGVLCANATGSFPFSGSLRHRPRNSNFVLGLLRKKGITL
jgi:hypothetical protein